MNAFNMEGTSASSRAIAGNAQVVFVGTLD